MGGIGSGKIVAIDGFDRPDRQENVPVDPETLLDHVKPALVLLAQALTLRNRELGNPRIEVVPDLRGEFRLVISPFENQWIDLLDAAQYRVVGVAGNSALGGHRVELGNPLLESRIGVRGSRQHGGQSQCRNPGFQRLQDTFRLTHDLLQFAKYESRA